MAGRGSGNQGGGSGEDQRGVNPRLNRVAGAPGIDRGGDGREHDDDVSNADHIVALRQAIHRVGRYTDDTQQTHESDDR